MNNEETELSKGVILNKHTLDFSNRAKAKARELETEAQRFAQDEFDLSKDFVFLNEDAYKILFDTFLVNYKNNLDFVKFIINTQHTAILYKAVINYMSHYQNEIIKTKMCIK